MTTTWISEGYGWIDRACPRRVYLAGPKGEPRGYTLGEVWRELRGVGNCGIVRLADDQLIAERPSNWAWRYRGGALRQRAAHGASSPEPARMGFLEELRHYRRRLSGPLAACEAVPGATAYPESATGEEAS